MNCKMKLSGAEYAAPHTAHAHVKAWAYLAVALLPDKFSNQYKTGPSSTTIGTVKMSNGTNDWFVETYRTGTS